MGTNLHDVYYCQLDRNQVLSDRMYKRNIPSVQMGASYFSRPVDTYATVFVMVDNHKQATVKRQISVLIHRNMYLIQEVQHHMMDILEM